MKHGNPKLAAFADKAIDVIRTLVTDPNAPPSIRLRAAKLILDSTPDREDDDDGDDDNTKAAPGPRPIPLQPAGPGPVAAQPPEPVRPRPKVGRNDTCACGSGLKFKKCCLGKADQPGPPVVTPFARPAPLAREGPPAAAA